MNMNPASKNTFAGLMMLNQIGYQRTMMIKPTVEMIKQLPIYVDYGVIAHCPTDVERKTFFERVAPTVMKLFERDGGLKSSAVIDAVSATSRQDLADQLVACGYSRDSLPTECGGEWSVAKFRQWQLERMELERQRELEYFGVSRRTTATVSMGDLEQKYESENFAVTQRPSSPLATMEELDKRWEWENLARAPLPPTPAAATLDEVEQTMKWEEDPRVMTQTSSFPSSATMRGLEQNVESKSLDEDTAKKPASSTDAMDDYKRRVAEAMKEDELLRGTTYEAERLERKRILDREHSKRKRLRRKDRFATLQESHHECLAENARLKKESAFLKKLLKESKKVIKCHVSGNADGSASIGSHQSVVAATSTASQRKTGNDDGSVSIGSRQSVAAASSTANQLQTGNDGGPVSIGSRQSVVAASSTANQRRTGNDDGSVSIGSRQSVVAASSATNQRQTGNDDGYVSMSSRQSVTAASSAANQRQTGNDDGYVSMSSRQSVTAASSAANQPQMWNDDGSVSIYNRQSVVAAASTAKQHHVHAGHDGSTPASLLTDTLPISSFMNRQSDVAPCTTAGGAGMNESVYNQLLAASTTFPSWLIPFSWPNSLAQSAPGSDVTNNAPLLNMLQQQQQQQQQQQLNSFQQREVGPDVTNNALVLNMTQQQQHLNSFLSPHREAASDKRDNGVLLNMMMQQHPLVQSQPLVYPPSNHALYSNNNNHPHHHHQSPVEERKNDDTTTALPFR
jgi:hypothetical protein